MSAVRTTLRDNARTRDIRLTLFSRSLGIVIFLAGWTAQSIALYASGQKRVAWPAELGVSRRTEGIVAPQDFCQALQRNDRAALKALIDPELATLDAQADAERNFRALKEWLERHDCVASVEVGRGVLRSNPPIKQFHVTVRMAPEDTAERDIGIRLSPKRYEFNLK